MSYFRARSDLELMPEFRNDVLELYAPEGRAAKEPRECGA